MCNHWKDRTLSLLRTELEIQKAEQEEALFYASLEQLFIEERIYKDKEFEEAKNIDAAVKHIDKRLKPFKPQLIRSVTRDDILRLMEIKIGRSLKFNASKNDELIKQIHQDLVTVQHHLAHIVDYTVDWFNQLKQPYGAATHSQPD